jgi:hypothetical protein
LEQFNPIGGFRNRFRSLGEGDRVATTIRGRAVRYRLGRAVDPSGHLSTGQSFANFRELRNILAADQDRLAKALATKLLIFATGREMGFSDRPEIARIVQQSAQRQYRVQELIHQVIASRIFHEK